MKPPRAAATAERTRNKGAAGAMPEPTRRHKNHNIISFAGNQDYVRALCNFRCSYKNIFALMYIHVLPQEQHYS
jgi:uncharacterized protein YutD